MTDMTLILTRTPKQEFFYVSGARSDTNEEHDDLTDEQMNRLFRQPTTKSEDPPDIVHKSGRWGTLGLIKGPKISSAQFIDPPRSGTPDAQRAPTDTTQVVQFANRYLKLTTDGRVMEPIVEYTTIERFRTDAGGYGYIELHPAPDKAYRIYKGTGYDLLINMRPQSNGDYIKIVEDIPDADLARYSALQLQVLEKEKAILIHEAVNVTWLVGCISPRPKNNRGAFDKSDPNNASAIVMRTLFAALRSAPKGEGSLFVMDV